jgi:hypothetical protein
MWESTRRIEVRIFLFKKKRKNQMGFHMKTRIQFSRSQTNLVHWFLLFCFSLVLFFHLGWLLFSPFAITFFLLLLLLFFHEYSSLFIAITLLFTAITLHPLLFFFFYCYYFSLYYYYSFPLAFIIFLLLLLLCSFTWCCSFPLMKLFNY